MKLSVKGTVVAATVLWAGSFLFVGIINRFFPDYGWWFLKALDSIYPGYHVALGLKNLFVGVGYAVLDGVIGGFLFASIYNCASACCCKKEEKKEEA